MPRMSKLSRELLKEMKPLGWSLHGSTKQGHNKWVHKYTGAVVITSGTPSDRRGPANDRAMMLKVASDFNKSVEKKIPVSGETSENGQLKLTIDDADSQVAMVITSVAWGYYAIKRISDLNHSALLYCSAVCGKRFQRSGKSYTWAGRCNELPDNAIINGTAEVTMSPSPRLVLKLNATPRIIDHARTMPARTTGEPASDKQLDKAETNVEANDMEEVMWTNACALCDLVNETIKQKPDNITYVWRDNKLGVEMNAPQSNEDNADSDGSNH